MADPIRYAILDGASDDAALWELPLARHQDVDGRMVEVHPRRSVEQVMPHLLDLLREGHVEMYPYEDPNGSRLSLEVALAQPHPIRPTGILRQPSSGVASSPRNQATMNTKLSEMRREEVADPALRQRSGMTPEAWL